LDAGQCACGAIFVGQPLDALPLKVQRLGPAITSLTLLMIVATGAIIGTKWLAFASVFVIWSAWRAVRLSRREPESYGGFRTAATTLALTLSASAALAAYGIAQIPRALDNYRIRRIAATQAAMYHYWSVLENYKGTSGSYPKNAQQLKEATGESAPTDYWERSIKFQSRTDAIADRSIQVTGIQLTNFELRSAGPDGVVGTDDDIIMRDGMFLPSSEVKPKPVVQQLR
jgi:hypothetical protein